MSPCISLTLVLLQYVDELLSVAGLQGSTQVPVPSHHYEDPDLNNAPPSKTMALNQALAKCYDLRWNMTSKTCPCQCSAPLSVVLLSV